MALALRCPALVYGLVLVVCLSFFRHSGHARVVGGMRVGQPGVGHGLSMGALFLYMGVSESEGLCEKLFLCVLFAGLRFAFCFAFCFVCVGVVLGGG